MKTGLTTLMLSILLMGCAQTNRPGSIERNISMNSEYIGNRLIDVWLPQDYSNEKSYAVLYMQDGEMVFDAEHAWNGQSWNAHLTAGKLMHEEKIRDMIIVAIRNGGYARHSEYFPQKVFEQLSATEQEQVIQSTRPNGSSVFNGFKIQSDNYLRFLVEELKPHIDSTYSTHRDAANTFIAGSSMGGLISCYAVCEYPEVFGGAACLSTHWPGIFLTDNNPVPAQIFEYLKSNLPAPGSHKFYFDHGTVTLDSMYPKLQNEVNEIMSAKGYTGDNFKTLVFKGASHTEKSWAERFDIPLKFLLSK